MKQYFGQVAYKPRPKFLPFVQQMEFETQLEYYEDRNTRPGKLASRQTELSWTTEFRNSSELFFRPVEDVTDVLTEAFEIRPGIVIPKGAYRFNRPRVSFSSNQSRKLVFTASEKWGDFYSGTRSETQAGITLRPNPHLLIDVTDSYNRVRLPQGRFSTNLFGGRISYNFSRRLLTSAFVQLNSAAQLSSVNFRLRYIFRPYSDLFVIYLPRLHRERSDHDRHLPGEATHLPSKHQIRRDGQEPAPISQPGGGIQDQVKMPLNDQRTRPGLCPFPAAE